MPTSNCQHAENRLRNCFANMPPELIRPSSWRRSNISHIQPTSQPQHHPAPPTPSTSAHQPCSGARHADWSRDTPSKGSLQELPESQTQSDTLSQYFPCSVQPQHSHSRPTPTQNLCTFPCPPARPFDENRSGCVNPTPGVCQRPAWPHPISRKATFTRPRTYVSLDLPGPPVASAVPCMPVVYPNPDAPHLPQEAHVCTAARPPTLCPCRMILRPNCHSPPSVPAA
mmetsp:Transcript_37826/g.84618  ORF Transcript_37826/g.84618 Transcript_37826/m.84618 type:complete len:227 (-) Transcript_37826:799-1479(-)